MWAVTDRMVWCATVLAGLSFSFTFTFTITILALALSIAFSPWHRVAVRLLIWWWSTRFLVARLRFRVAGLLGRWCAGRFALSSFIVNYESATFLLVICKDDCHTLAVLAFRMAELAVGYFAIAPDMHTQARRLGVFVSQFDYFTENGGGFF